ncbi:MAG: MBL fold metallo-hydrolase [Acidobacteriota bacterium]
MPDAIGKAVELGDLKLTLVSDGGFKLDGGAMFGVVPKPLWQRSKPADDRNRIQMATNCLLVERGDALVLVDTGIGDKHDEKFADIFGLEGGVRLPESIESAGYALTDVTHVVMTHLHFDHCGWNTRRDGDALVPTFPNARYVMSQGELEHADAPNERDRASYLPENWRPLVDADVVDLFDGEAEPVPGVRVIEVPGHNANMCIVRLDGGGPEHQAVFWADLIPTAAHVAYPWVMGYDLYPLQTLANKQEWIPRAAAGGWLSIFEHESDEPFARLVEAKPGRFRAEPVAVD